MTRAGEDDRCRRHARFARIDAAFKAGDFAALSAEAGSDDRFPDAFADLAIGGCLQYAIYHAPVALIAALLDAGADPDFDDGDGFPPLVAAMSKLQSAPGASPRSDVHQILELLLARGAHPDQRGINDYTPLHWAAASGNLEALELLLAAGADPVARTRVDDFETPRDVAERASQHAAAARLAAAEQGP